MVCTGKSKFMTDEKSKVVSSHGEFEFDGGGEVVVRDICCVSMGCDTKYASIVRFDIDEWKSRHKRLSAAGLSIDILDIGYWLADGGYEPPESDCRKDSETINEQEVAEINLMFAKKRYEDAVMQVEEIRTLMLKAISIEAETLREYQLALEKQSEGVL